MLKHPMPFQNPANSRGQISGSARNCGLAFDMESPWEAGQYIILNFRHGEGRQMNHKSNVSRRRLLKQGALLVTGGLIANGRDVIAQTTHTPADTTKVLGAFPSEVGGRSPFVSIKREIGRLDPDGYSMTPLESLSGIITPSDLHFERHHAGIPAIDPDRYELLVHGLLDRPLKFSLADLKRFPSVSRICFIECSGNGYKTSFDRPDIPEEVTPGQLDGLISTSEWTGVRLSTLFREAGVRKTATWFLAEGQDAAVMTRSIPMSKAWDDALVVYAQNGEALRPEQGYPVRLLLPGWEGNASVKWLRRIEASDAPFMTREETAKYADARTTGKVEMFTFTMGPKSLITSPSYPRVLPGKGWWEINGFAWSGNGKIDNVDISVNGGKTWQPANLHEPILSKCTTRFTFPWHWNGKAALFMSRATDTKGVQQPSVSEARKGRGPRTYYHNNVIRPWRIDADGRITFGLNTMV
jgi:sulfane dehydrogenase subunit SoxC